MKSQYRVVIVGGGVVGASIAYHLTKLGWADVAILERSVLTAGSSWHAAGGYHALNADPNIASLQAYTIDVLSRLEQETGQATGLHMTGGITFACTPDRWEWLQAAYRVFQTMGIEDVRLMSPAGDQDRLPHHQHRRRLRRHVGRPRGLCRHDGRGAGLCQGRQAARRRGDRA